MSKGGAQVKRLVYGIILYLILLLPPVISFLENHMVTHMLLQMPLLIVVGVLIGDYVIKRFPSFFNRWNGSGIPGITLVFLVTMYWMLPRAMDEALALQTVEIFKYVSFPFLVGVPLLDSWRRLKAFGKGFIIFNYIPMFGMMAWLYIDSPIQVCNNYLESEQKMLGWGFLIITLFMLLHILQKVFVDQTEKTAS